MMFEKIIITLLKKEINNKLNYLNKYYLDNIIEKMIEKKINKIITQEYIDKKIENIVLNKSSKLLEKTEFNSLNILRQQVQKIVQEQFKLETGEYFYQALVKLINQNIIK